MPPTRLSSVNAAVPSISAPAAPLEAAGDAARIAEAASAFHRPGQSADQVIRLLVEAASGLGLASEAFHLSASAAEAGTVRDPDLVDVPVLADDDLRFGNLLCSGVARPALPALRALAAHAGQALAGQIRLRAVQHEAADVRRVSEALQDALLPEPPPVPHTTLAVGYRAASREAKVGGDFYDVAPLPDGQVLIVVGDVMGKGIEAAVHTSLITQTLRSLALAGHGLEQLLERADTQVRWQRDELMATLWCGLYDPATGELAFASLGHPPALLLRASGEHLRLELHGLPLGMRELSPDPPEVRTRRLEPRDLLVLYTDGVVEAHRDYLAGQEALLAALVARANNPVGEILDSALDELLADAGHADDAAMLLLRRR